MNCTMCNTQLYGVMDKDPLSNSTQVEDGIILIFSGGYGMFTDTMMGMGFEDPMAILCHDCTIKILKLFPDEFKEKFVGSSHLHSGSCGYNCINV